MNKGRAFLLFLLVFGLIPSHTHAGGSGFLGLSIGYFNALDGDEQSAADFRIEYRPDSPIFIRQLKPWAGAEVTSRGSAWAGAGLLLDLKLSNRLYLIPSFGAGLYAHNGRDPDLDHPIQFRSQLELAYAFDNQSRLGLAFSHLSNAGLGDQNPGTEAVSLYWHVPIDFLFGKNSGKQT